jgi:hypothetical protein
MQQKLSKVCRIYTTCKLAKLAFMTNLQFIIISYLVGHYSRDDCRCYLDGDDIPDPLELPPLLLLPLPPPPTLLLLLPPLGGGLFGGGLLV